MATKTSTAKKTSAAAKPAKTRATSGMSRNLSRAATAEAKRTTKPKASTRTVAAAAKKTGKATAKAKR